METTGLVIGIAGLAGLFSACLDLIEVAQSYESFDDDSKDLDAQFDGYKVHFQRWGRSVGLLETGERQERSHHQGLDGPVISKEVKTLLERINKHFKEEVLDERRQAAARATGEGLSTVVSAPHAKPSRWEKVNWVLRGRAKRIKEVAWFGETVGLLYNLVPIDNHAAYPDKSDWNKLQTALAHIEQDLEQQIHGARVEKVYDWLTGRFPSSSDVYEESRRRRVHKTCDWILHRDHYIAWLSSDFPGSHPKILWLHAPAGFGKTVLCSRLIEHASSISLPFPPAYFFFSSEHESHSDPYVAIRFWIRQIVSQNDTTFRMAAMQAEAETGQEASRSSLVRLLNDIVHAVSGYTLIADGLDECAIRVRDFLFDIKMAIKGSNTRILIASRHQSSIHDSLIADNEGINFAELRILPEDTQADILAYSNSIVSQKLSQKPQDTQHEISKVMVDRCQGQFLWMKLQSDSLRNTLSKKQLQKAISNTPSGIMRVYERSWQKVMDMPERDRNRAIDLLRWVVFATRPMNVGEIIEAVQVDMNDHGGLPFDPDELPDFMDEEYVNSEITALCQSFVEIRPPASAPSTDLLQSTVHLTHFTVREFLLSTVNPSIPSHMAPATQGKAGIFAVASAEHGNLARRCLHFIILSMALEERPGNSAAPDFMFKDYAGRWWYRHYQDMDKDEVASRLAQELFNHDHPCWARWSTMFEESHILETLIRSGGPASGPLCFASVLGLADLVSHLLEHGHQVNDRWRGGVSALEMASYRGRNQVVSVLLTAGARADGAGADGRRAIHYAVAGGRHETAKILIQGGADINTRDQQGATALLRAAELGDAAMVRLLIESRADTKVRQETDGWVPLHSAAQNGHLEVARMLLARSRAEIHLKTNEGHTPLTLSAREGRDMLVKLLIDSGARVNDKDNYGWMPLHHAAFHGRLVASDLLINAGADMNSKNSFNNFSPLGHALHFKNWEVAKLIIGAGADVNQWIDDSQQPLHYASVEGLLDITEALITAGADVHAKGRLNWTALHYAARNGHQTVSDLLIKAGADINATGQSGWTPLHVAAFYGHIHISDFLVKSGANLNVESIGGKLPIHYALLHEHWEIVRLLSTAGLNI